MSVRIVVYVCSFHNEISRLICCFVYNGIPFRKTLRETRYWNTNVLANFVIISIFNGNYGAKNKIGNIFDPLHFYEEMYREKKLWNSLICIFFDLNIFPTGDVGTTTYY